LSNEHSENSLDNIFIPDRYEVLSRTNDENLNTIVVKVDDTLHDIDAIFTSMKTAGRGAFAILRGDSGAGKTTFLHTLKLYREGVETLSISGGEDIPAYLRRFSSSSKATLQIIVLEEREAAVSFTDEELDTWLHVINAFIRRPENQACLIVWPCNSDGLKTRLVKLATQIGGRSLLGSRGDAIVFKGPEKNLYPEIAVRTLGTLNQGAGLSDFGITEVEVLDAASVCDTVGDFLGALRDIVIEKQANVEKLVGKDHPRVWVVVIAGNDPAGDVAGLTRGNLSLVDMDRLMSSTNANIVKDLKKFPEKLGVLATVLNAKILHLPVLAATAAVRAFADDKLVDRLRKEDFQVTAKKPDEAVLRIQQSEFGSIFSQGTQKTLTTGKKLGSQSRASFEKVARIASADDAAVNRTICRALVESGLISSFDVEVALPGKYAVRSDILAQTEGGPIRIEMMWRTRTGRADIANYTLKKLEVYGKAIGLLD